MIHHRHIGHLHTGTGWGGGEYQVLNLLTGLSQRKIKATLFAHPKGRLFAQARKSGLAVEPLIIPALSRFLPFTFFNFSQRFQEQPVDLLHVHDSRATTIGVRAAKGLRVPIVLSRRIASPLRRNLISRKKYSSRNIDAVIAVSQTVKRVVAQSGYPQERIHVVASGLDIPFLDNIQPDDQFRRKFEGAFLVGGIGTLSVKKNWKMLIEVAAHIGATRKDIDWVLVGDGPERNRLEKLAERYGVSNRIHFLGFQPDAARLLRNVDVLFFPSLREGTPGVVREAMILNVPVVAVDAPGTVEALGGHGWPVKSDDITGAADIILKILHEPEMRAVACEKARQSALQRFSIHRTIQETIDVYHTVLKNNR